MSSAIAVTRCAIAKECNMLPYMDTPSKRQFTTNLKIFNQIQMINLWIYHFLWPIRPTSFSMKSPDGSTVLLWFDKYVSPKMCTTAMYCEAMVGNAVEEMHVATTPHLQLRKLDGCEL